MPTSRARQDPAPASLPREGYRTLLATSRLMRRDHAIARDAWFAALKIDQKAELLFELEMLLKGLACFANPRNHPGPRVHGAIVAVDFREPLLVARDGATRVLAIVRQLLGEQDRNVAFQRYLEHAATEDGARARLSGASSTQETPEDALLGLRLGFAHLLEMFDALAEKESVSFRTFYALLGLAQREIARNAFFNPIVALEFRPEFDKIDRAEILQLVQSVPGEEAHRLVSLAFLALFRMKHYLALVETIAMETTPARAFLLLAALRSDGRSLAQHLRKQAGVLLAEGFERDIFSSTASALQPRYETLLAEGHRLIGIRGALDAVAARLRLELRRGFERELPPVTLQHPMELRKRLLAALDHLRSAIEGTIDFVAHALDARTAPTFDDRAARRDTSERLRRDVWMFAQIVRAFAAKSAVMRTPDRADRWGASESFGFVREFLGYFRAMGYPLLRTHDYPRFDQFLAAMSSLEETDLLDPVRMATATQECEAFYVFLLELFEGISKREELAGVAFDKRAAAETLRMYLTPSPRA
jgi:hypothetical protein